MLKNVVCHCYKGVFLAIHSAVLAEKGKTVHIGVYYKGNVMLALLHQGLYVAKVLFQRFGIVLEVSGRFGKESGYGLHAQLFKKFGKDYTAHAVHAVKSHLEVGLGNGVRINQIQRQYHVDVLLVVSIILAILAQMIHIRILKVFSLGNTKHLVAFFLVQEFALFVQQLQGIPHAGIVAGSNDDAATSAFHGYSDLGCRGCGQTDVHHIKAHAHQGSTHYVLYHLTAYTGIASHNNLVALNLGCASYQCGISRSELYDIQWIKGITGWSSDGSADT